MSYSQNATLDVLTELEDGAAAITADGAGSGIIDFQGSADVIGSPPHVPEIYADLFVDVSAIDIASNDERYQILIQLSTSATFASGILNYSILELGDVTALIGNADIEVALATNVPIRLRVPVGNEVNGIHYRYMRLWVVVAGTTPSITFKADLRMRRG